MLYLKVVEVVGGVGGKSDPKSMERRLWSCGHIPALYEYIFYFKL